MRSSVFEYIDYAATEFSDMPNDEKSEASDKLVDWLYRQIVSPPHPLVVRWVASTHSVRGIKNTEPWHAYAEQLYVTACFVNTNVALTLCNGDGTGQRQADVIDRAGIGGRVYSAQTYLLSSETQKTIDAMPLPKHTVSKNIMPYPLMFFSYEESWKLAHPALKDRETNWLMLAYESTQIGVYSDALMKDGSDLWINAGRIPFGDVYPTDFPLPEGAAPVLKLLAFINSPYVEAAPSRMPRPIRRSMGKRKDVDREITTVILRRRAPQPEKAWTEGSETREYHYRWWVSGHIRAQWYPSEKAHHLIYVAPYLKGPDGAPLKERVYHVKR